MKIKLIIILMLAAVLSCHRHEADSRLQDIAGLCGSNPKAALDSLRAIERTRLSEPDQYLYDFIEIKASDKAYIRHTSDSLILKVVEYESRHKSNGRYPEALYYAGRVYSDLGDYPQAIRYFQDALDALGKNSSKQDLEAKITIQYARLLTSLRLYEEAIPLIEASIEMARQRRDSINEVYNMHLLGWTLMNADSLDKAENVFREAFLKSKFLSSGIMAKSQMQLASIKYRKEQTDSALMLIEGLPDKVNPASRNRALALAALINMKAGRVDSAYRYAKDLLLCPDSNNKLTGYEILLSPEVIMMLGNTDTIAEYVSEYMNLISERYDDNESQLALLQQSRYNYQQHLRAKEKAQKRTQVALYTSAALLILIFALIIIVLLLRNRNRHTIIQLQAALEEARRFERTLKVLNHEKEERRGENIPAPAESESETIADEPMQDNSQADDTLDVMAAKTEPFLREEYREILLSTYENMQTPVETPVSITESSIYARLKDMVAANESLAKTNSLWKDLEQEVLKCSPDFKTKLKLLAGGKFSSYDMQTALLIKCGFTNKEMSILFDRKKGTIVSRRESLCKRVFDRQLGAATIDGIIRLL